MPRVTVGGTEISYSVHGEGPQVLLLVHGWGLSGAAFRALGRHLDPRRFRLLVPDLRGTGDSGRPSTGYTLDQYAEDVLAVADHAGARRFVAVGHSMGGQVALLAAATEPSRVEGLVLVNPVPPSGLPLPPEVDALLRGAAGNPEAHRAIYAACLVRSEEVQRRMLEDALRIPQACLQGALDAWSRASFVERVRGLEVPTRVVASDDPFLPVELLREKLLSLLPRAELARLEGVGHHVPSERPEALARLVASFVEEVAFGAAGSDTRSGA